MHLLLVGGDLTALGAVLPESLKKWKSSAPLSTVSNSLLSSRYMHYTNLADNSIVIDLIKVIVEIHKHNSSPALVIMLLCAGKFDARPVVTCMTAVSMDLHVCIQLYMLRGTLLFDEATISNNAMKAQ